MIELKDRLLGSGGLLILILSIIQIAPIKINPWSAQGYYNSIMSCFVIFPTQEKILSRYLRKLISTKDIAANTKTTKTTALYTR